MRIVDYLEQWAQAQPDRLFITEQDGATVTYGAFWQQVCERTGEILALRKPHQALVLRTTQSIDYLTRYFACHKAGVVAVPVEKDLPDDNLQSILRQLAGVTFPAESADVLFTSGSTGVPKGVVLSHKALVADAENLTQAQGFHHDLTFIITGPLNHFGSHSKILPIVQNGASLYLLEGMKTLEAFYAALSSTTGPVATFLVPASIRILLQFSASRLQNYSSRFELLETGAAPISLADMQHLVQLLPTTRLFNTYAGSEVGVVCTYNFNDGLTLAGCVGRAYPLSHVSLRDGVVVCSGAGTMMGYLGKSLVECVPEVVTTDLGCFDEEGRLFLTGRQNDLINVGGLKVSPVEVEEVAASVIPGLRECICIAQPNALVGFVPKLLVVMQPYITLDKHAAARLFRLRLEAYKVPVNIVEVDHIEHTNSGKVDRKFYRS